MIEIFKKNNLRRLIAGLVLPLCQNQRNNISNLILQLAFLLELRRFYTLCIYIAHYCVFFVKNH